MKKRLQGLVAGVLAGTLIGGIPAIAKETAESITAVYRNIQLVVDGVLVEPKDAEGNYVEPFIYNGTTYLPVRAVATAFNTDVSWDGNNSIVYLGTQSEKPAKEVPIWNKPYTNCSNTSRIKSWDKKGNGYIECDMEAQGEETTYGWFRSETVEYPLNSLAKTLSGKFFVKDDFAGNKAEGVLKIYNSNNQIIYTSPIMRISTEPIDFNINVENEISVKFVFEQKTSDYSRIKMFIQNPTIVTTDY